MCVCVRVGVGRCVGVCGGRCVGVGVFCLSCVCLINSLKPFDEIWFYL